MKTRIKNDIQRTKERIASLRRQVEIIQTHIKFNEARLKFQTYMETLHDSLHDLDHDIPQNQKRYRYRNPVSQYDQYGNHIEDYETIKEAATHTGISYKNINAACNGLVHTAGGYVWKYIDLYV